MALEKAAHPRRPSGALHRPVIGSVGWVEEIGYVPTDLVLEQGRVLVEDGRKLSWKRRGKGAMVPWKRKVARVSALHSNFLSQTHVFLLLPNGCSVAIVTTYPNQIYCIDDMSDLSMCRDHFFEFTILLESFL